MFDLATTNQIAAYATIFLDISALGLVLGTLYPRIVPAFKERFHAQYGLWVAFMLTLTGTLVTLYYSEFLAQAPCALCWFQRVFLYPQVVLFFIAALMKDTRVVWYSIGLSVIGACIALYHHWLQMGGSHLFPCPANGNAIDCATPTFVTWGFVTFPFMAFSLFIFLTLFMVWLMSLWRKYPLARAE